jgi:hypothetical protein
MTVPPLLHLMPVHRLVSRLGARRGGYSDPPIDTLAQEVDAWLTRLPWPWRTTCLKRASILYALLRRSGDEVELHIGVKRESNRNFAAHAWLMKNGTPFLEPAGSDFATFQVITAFPEKAS